MTAILEMGFFFHLMDIIVKYFFLSSFGKKQIKFINLISIMIFMYQNLFWFPKKKKIKKIRVTN